MRSLAVIVIVTFAAATREALDRPAQAALGMSAAALLIALATAGYVYVKVVRAGRQGARVTALEAAASELPSP